MEAHTKWRNDLNSDMLTLKEQLQPLKNYRLLREGESASPRDEHLTGYPSQSVTDIYITIMMKREVTERGLGAQEGKMI